MSNVSLISCLVFLVAVSSAFGLFPPGNFDFGGFCFPPERCPAGFSCTDIKVLRFFGGVFTWGKCRKLKCPNGSSVGESCSTDSNCMGIGATCYQHTTSLDGICCKDGCPKVRDDQVGICVLECDSTINPCANGDICCSNGCGTICRSPGN